MVAGHFSISVVNACPIDSYMAEFCAFAFQIHGLFIRHLLLRLLMSNVTPRSFLMHEEKHGCSPMLRTMRFLSVLVS